ncbi:hypothetical protein BDF19DRAFT_470419 [Syncephalis fuscata]|nr:hypothetical protein BDF19DRAFT_470419 [Syncephalis fuscata]
MGASEAAGAGNSGAAVNQFNLPFKFLHNRVSTAKYNIVTFLPKFLYEQFSKYANLFFLFTSCIQQVKDVSPTNRWSTAIPLAVVLIATAFKEIMEDRKRHLSDAETNARYTKTLSGDVFVDAKWRDVHVGDIVRVEGGEAFPADLILISSSEPEGLCYIETSNLDGETNLKIKQALTETVTMITPQDVARLEGYIECEQPNNSLYTFDGTLILQKAYGGERQQIPLDPTQQLLRGAILRNTRWIYGVVVFTGHETKLMRNASATPIKRTSVEKMTNVQILFLFGLLIVLSVACALGTFITDLKYSNTMSYVPRESSVKDFFYNILTSLFYLTILFHQFDCNDGNGQVYQSTLINSDLDMYYEPTDTPALARTSSLVEELGQIEYIFSDKTGTLTCNMMEFRQSSIAGLMYSDAVDPSQRAKVIDGEVVGLHDFDQLREHTKTHENRNTMVEFLTLLSACHTVIPEVNNGVITYQASSPDEAALVAGAQQLGYVFTVRRPKSITIEINGEPSEFEILNICEFNSTRKRMSAVVRGPDGRIKLYTKGADTVILERLAPNNPFVEPTLEHLEEYATEGLRTLCLAMREIPEEEYRQWSVIYDKAATTLVNRSDELDKAAELIEKDLFLLGATAIEDKLQDGVPETIYTLAQAGIKIWVLTGDRQETAINIGYSCKLIQEDMSLIICNEETHWETKEFLEKKLNAIRSARSGFENEPLALVIDGHSLKFALEKDIELTLLELACMCKAVICCRVSPLQKALVVKLVKKHKKAILLAIGDGANDVSMIQAAHVGVGINGLEGMQAARSSDFAISQFRFLRKLLLVHGAWSYQRLSKLILYSFYKNICLYMTQFWFAFYNGFSGQIIYESWTISAYNVIFTVLPPLAIGIFDQYLGARMLDRYPELYQLGQKKEFFNVRNFWGWTANAFYHSLVLFFAAVLIFSQDLILPNGTTGGHWAFGTTLYTAVLGTVLLKAALINDLWTKFSWVSIPGSFIVWILLFALYASVTSYTSNFALEYKGLLPVLYGSGVFWFTIIVLPIFAFYVIMHGNSNIKRMYFPRTYHYIQEIQKFNIPDYRPRMERFRKAVHKVRLIQRLKRNRGFAFSQSEAGQAHLIRAYDTTMEKPRG